MKRITPALFIGIIVGFGVAAFAQDIVAPTADEWTGLLAKIATLQGASTMAIVTVVIQGLMLLFRSPLGEKTGQYRLTIVFVLSFLAALGAELIKAPSVNISVVIQAMMSAPVVAAVQVLINQVGKQYLTPKGSV